MLKLTHNLHAMLSDRIVEVLKEKNIITVSDFLHTDSNRLTQLLNIGERITTKEIILIKTIFTLWENVKKIKKNGKRI